MKHKGFISLLSIPLILLLAVNVYSLNNKCGISISFPGSTENVDYAIEQFYYDAMYDDHAVVVVKDSATFSIALAHNANNIDQDGNPNADNGIITCMFDGDELYRWRDDATYIKGDSKYGFATSTGVVWPYNNTPFTLSEKSQGIGDNGSRYRHIHPTWYYSGATDPEPYFFHCHYGMLDDYGDEWHTLTYWDNDDSFFPGDGKIIYFVVNPKTPVISFSTLTATAQYYTTPPKTYYKPKIWPQTTYLTNDVKIKLTNVTDTSKIYYRVGTSGSWTEYTAELDSSSLFSSANQIYDFQHKIESQGIIKTRKIHYKPNSPSQGETHPVLLYRPEDEETIRTRCSDSEYLTLYNTLKNPASIDPIMARNYRDGLRHGKQENGWCGTAANLAFLYRMENNDSYAEKVKSMLLTRSHDLIGFVFSQQFISGIPEYQIVNSWRNAHWIIAYDLIAGYSGMTSIEEYKIRDHLANMTRAVLLRSWYLNNHNHMLNTYNQVAAAAIAMPTYDTLLGHAIGTDREGDNATTLEPTPSWMNTVYDKLTHLNPDNTVIDYDLPGYNAMGLWGRVPASGRWDEVLAYYVYKLYYLLPQFTMFRNNFDGVNLLEIDDRFKHNILRHIFTRRPSDNNICPYDCSGSATRPASYGLFFWPYINHHMDVEYFPGQKISQLARWHNDFMDNAGYSAVPHDWVDNDPIRFVVYDNSIQPEAPSKNSYISPAGFSFYSDITNSESIFLYQHGEDMPSYDFKKMPDQMYLNIDAFGQRFTAVLDDYHVDAPNGGTYNKPGHYNHVLVDSSDLSTGIGTYTEALTDKFFESSYMDYASVKTQLNSPNDSSVFANDVQQTRNIFFPDKKFFVLVDQMRSGNNHTYDWMFHGSHGTWADPSGSVTNQNNNEVIVTKATGERLKVFYIGPNVTLTQDSLQPGTAYVRARAAQAQNLDFHVLMIPVDNGASTPSIHNKSSSDDYYASKITYDNTEFITFSQVDPVSRTAEGITIDADLAIVKLTDGAVDYFQANNCINLSVGPVEFLNSSERINITLKTNSDGYAFQIEPDNSATISTQLTIGGLTPSITYTLTDNEFTDSFGNKTQVAQYTFQSDADGKYTYVQNCSKHEITIQSGDHVPVVNNPSGNNDTTAPVISNLRIIGIGSDKATIIWTTDEESTSRVEYGVNTSYGSISDVDSNLVTSHSITISGLSAGIQYHIRAISADNAGNGTVSSDYTFRTAVDDIEAKSYPNPYEYSENNPMTFEFPNIDDGGTLKMYTIAGKLIRTIELPVGEIRIQWDGKDENGFVVASGLYLYVLTTSEGKLKKGKFAFVK